MRFPLVLFVVALPALVLPAHAQDPGRTAALEEEVRRLTGRVEELSFQLLQMEERMRKAQEDIEFRFEQLEEEGEEDATDGADGAEQPSETDAEVPATPPRDERAALSPERSGTPSEPARSAKPAKPTKKGTLTFDDDGRLVGAPGGVKSAAARRRETTAAATAPFGTAADATIAASRFGSTPDAVFERGRALFGNESYDEAAAAFRAHITAWPKDGREAEARYWLGRALFQSGEYYDAAAALLDAHNGFPDAPTAPDALLALGLSLAGLEQREVACATYAEVLKRYPEARGRLEEQVRAEQASTRC